MNRFDRPRQALAIAIAFLAGFVDALGFLSADRYFVSFMSGNTTRLAVDLATDPTLALRPALLIGGFVVGVTGGSIVAARAGPWRKPELLVLVTALLLLAAGVAGAGRGDAAVGAMVLAMGAVNNGFRREGDAAVGLTYMTGALVRLGQGIGAAIMGQRPTGSAAYLLLWSGLFVGALAGAVLFTRLGGAAFWLAALLALGLAAWAWWLVWNDRA
jgi:uncharacterized membrane protein YoaK (UPF0700 family)